MANPTLRTFLTGSFTKKQVYDFVLEKMIEQGKPGSKVMADSVTEYSPLGQTQCVYRGKGGTKCGVGHLVTDRDLREAKSLPRNDDTDVNNMTVYELVETLRLFDSTDQRRKDVYFLESLQTAHDDAESHAWGKHKMYGTPAFNCTFISYYKKLMKELKKEYKLKDSK